MEAGITCLSLWRVRALYQPCMVDNTVYKREIVWFNVIETSRSMLVIRSQTLLVQLLSMLFTAVSCWGSSNLTQTTSWCRDMLGELLRQGTWGTMLTQKSWVAEQLKFKFTVLCGFYFTLVCYTLLSVHSMIRSYLADCQHTTFFKQHENLKL